MKETDHPFKSKGIGWVMDSQSRLGIVKQCSIPQLETILSKEGQKLCPTVIQKTVEKAARGRLKRLKTAFNESLTAHLEHAAEHLPEGYSIIIHVERGNGEIKLMRPDESEISMDDYASDTCISGQFDQAVSLALDEINAEQIAREEKEKEET